MGCPLTIRIVSIAACAGLALLAHASEGATEISPNIANASWEDFKEMYPISALCEVDEITLWTCDDDEKTYSLCSSIEITEDVGYIQYRVGTEQGVNLVFPEHQHHPRGIFRQSLSPSGDVRITFRNSGHSYTLVDRLRGTSSIEVLPESESEGIAGVSCHNENQSLQLNYTLKLVYQAGIADR